MQITEPVPLRNGMFSHSDIVADANGWRLRFIFPGIDGRYNPTFLVVNAHELPHFITHLENAMHKYLMLKPIINADAELVETIGYVTLRVNGFRDGICLDRTQFLFRDLETMSDFVAVLGGIPARGEELVAGLRKAAGMSFTKARPDARPELRPQPEASPRPPSAPEAAPAALIRLNAILASARPLAPVTAPRPPAPPEPPPPSQPPSSPPVIALPAPNHSTLPSTMTVTLADRLSGDRGKSGRGFFGRLLGKS